MSYPIGVQCCPPPPPRLLLHACRVINMSSVSELLGPVLYTRTIPWVRTALNRTQVMYADVGGSFVRFKLKRRAARSGHTLNVAAHSHMGAGTTQSLGRSTTPSQSHGVLKTPSSHTPSLLLHCD